MCHESKRISLSLIGLCSLGLAFSGAFGCGGSGGDTKTGVPGAAKLLKEEDLYKYQGTGKNKQKMPVDTNERLRLLREAGKKIETH